MAWYRTGTVSVTNGSTTVTGSGTAWVGAINAGWGFNGPDGTVYEIATVVSATQITLASPYQGGTQSGASYSIVPTQGLEQNLVTGVNGLLTNYQGVYDGPGQGKFPDGVVSAPGVRFAADEDTGLYRPASNQLAAAVGGVQRTLLSSTGYQVNVPITGTAVQSSATDTTAGRLLAVGASATVLSASPALRASVGGTANAITLTTGAALSALPVGFCLRFRATGVNTGATTINVDGIGAVACRTITGVALPAGYIRSDVDTAAIYDGTYWVLDRQIEPGSNANGEYVRFADGTQICTSVFHATFGQTFALSKEWTFPASFVTGSSNNLVFSFAQNEAESSTTPNTNSIVGYDIGIPTTTNVQVRLRRVSGGTDFVAGDTAKTTATVIGRWF